MFKLRIVNLCLCLLRKTLRSSTSWYLELVLTELSKVSISTIFKKSFFSLPPFYRRKSVVFIGINVLSFVLTLVL